MKRISVALVAVALVAGACGSGGNDSPPSEGIGATTTGDVGTAETTVSVILDDFSVTPDTTSVPSGIVTFEVEIAKGAKAFHEFAVYRTDLPPDQLPRTSDNIHVDPTDERVELVGFLGCCITRRPETLETRLPAGSYVLLCNEADHYNRGMFVGFEVT